MLIIRNFRIKAVPMYKNTREFITALGGYRSVARRIDKRPTTVHSHMQSGSLPSAWYPALCMLAREQKIQEPDRCLFSFLKIPERHEDTARMDNQSFNKGVDEVLAMKPVRRVLGSFSR